MAHNPLTQYLDLYEAEAAAIAGDTPGVLDLPRAAALAALKKAGRLPEKSDPGFEKTSVAAMFAPDFGVNTRRMALRADVAASFRCGVPNLSTLMAFVVNDRFIPSATLAKNLPEGVTVCPLAEAVVKYPGTVGRYYGSVADTALPGVALNTPRRKGAAPDTDSQYILDRFPPDGSAPRTARGRRGCRGFGAEMRPHATPRGGIPVV